MKSDDFQVRREAFSNFSNKSDWLRVQSIRSFIWGLWKLLREFVAPVILYMTDGTKQESSVDENVCLQI